MCCDVAVGGCLNGYSCCWCYCYCMFNASLRFFRSLSLSMSFHCCFCVSISLCVFCICRRGEMFLCNVICGTGWRRWRCQGKFTMSCSYELSIYAYMNVYMSSRSSSSSRSSGSLNDTKKPSHRKCVQRNGKNMNVKCKSRHFVLFSHVYFMSLLWLPLLSSTLMPFSLIRQFIAYDGFERQFTRIIYEIPLPILKLTSLSFPFCLPHSTFATKKNIRRWEYDF